MCHCIQPNPLYLFPGGQYHEVAEMTIEEFRKVIREKVKPIVKEEVKAAVDLAIEEKLLAGTLKNLDTEAVYILIRNGVIRSLVEV